MNPHIPIECFFGADRIRNKAEVETLKINDALMQSITPAQKNSGLAQNTDSVEKNSPFPETSTETGRILTDLKAQGYVLSSEEADRISEFIESTEGSESEKLQTVKTALDKGIPLSARSLQGIRAALFKPVLSQELQRILADAQGEIPLDQVELLRFFAKLAGDSEDESLMKTGQAVAGELALGAATAASPLESGSDPAIEKQVMTWLLKALAQVTDTLGSLSEETESAAPLQERAVSGVSTDRSQPSSVQALTDVRVAGAEDIQETDSVKPDMSAAEAADAETSVRPEDQLISTLQQLENNPPEMTAEALMQGISLLMKEITPRMDAVKIEFESLRKALRTELRAVQQELENPKSAPARQTAEKIGFAIERLDKAILKSDIPLYTSMQAEKQLLTWSSELQEARSLLLAGDSPQAAAIVERIAKGVEEIRFQPAKLKVIHRTLQEAVSGNDITEKGLRQRAQQQISRILETVQTPREVLEAFKAMGLTHESEVVSVLGQGGKKIKDDWKPAENLKEILMKLAEDTQEKLTTVTGAEKTLNNLTGQQLLSRPEAKPQGQTLFFSLPMVMAERVEDLKIYVQSRKNEGKVDWENCTFYFAVHTEKYGDVGIRFAAARKSVSIQVKCDNQTLRDAVSPLVDDFKKTMWETGYQIAGISYSPLKDSKAGSSKTEENGVAESEGKGLNIKV